MKADWKPAETAPKNGSDFLARNSDSQKKIVFWDGGDFVDHQECMSFYVFEWTELPE